MTEHLELADGSERTETLSPLLPVSEVPPDQLPIVHISKGPRKALEIAGTKRAKNSPGSIDRHVRGIKGEYAVAKYYGDPEQVDTNIYEYGDGGVDLEMLGRVQIKTCNSSVNNPHLLVGLDEQLNADHYVQVKELGRSTYRIVGYAHRKKVSEAPISRLRFDGYAKRFRTVYQTELHPPPEPV